MKSTKKFKLKQAAIYGGIVAVLGGAVTGVAVGIATNTQEKLLLMGSNDFDTSLNVFNDNKEDAIKFIPVADPTKPYPSVNPVYAASSMRDSFSVKQDSAEYAKNPDGSSSKEIIWNKDSGIYVVNGFRMEASNAGHDNTLVPKLGFADNKEFIDLLLGVLKDQPSSVVTGKGFKIKLDAGIEPHVAPSLATSSTILVAGGTLTENNFLSLSFIFRSVILDFIERYASLRKTLDPINKLANEIKTTMPSSLSRGGVTLTAYMKSIETKLVSWKKTSINLYGKDITFGEYLKKAMVNQAAFVMVKDYYDNAIANNIPLATITASNDIPEPISDIDTKKDTLYGPYIGRENDGGLAAPKDVIESIKKLYTYTKVGGKDKTFSWDEPKSFDNQGDDAITGKALYVDPNDGSFKTKLGDYRKLSVYTTDTQYQYTWRGKYDRRFVKQSKLVIHPNVRNKDNEEMITAVDGPTKTTFEAVFKAMQDAAKAYKDPSTSADKKKIAAGILNSIFDSPAESKPTLDEMIAATYDPATNSLTMDVNVPETVYSQTLKDKEVDGITGSENIDVVQYALMKTYTPLIWNQTAYDNDKHTVTDIDGKEIVGSDASFSFMDTESVTNMVKKATDFIYPSGALNSAVFTTTSDSIYQNLVKQMNKYMTENRDTDNHYSIKTNPSFADAFKLGSDGLLAKDSDGNPEVGPDWGHYNAFSVNNKSVSSTLANMLVLSTFVLPKDGYNYTPLYLTEMQKMIEDGKDIIDPTGAFTSAFSEQIFTVLKYLARDENQISTGIALTKRNGHDTIGYQILGTSPSGTTISSIKIGEHEIKTHSIANKGFVLSKPGEKNSTKTFNRNAWISEPFNVGNYDNSIFTAPIAGSNMDSTTEPIKLFEADGTEEKVTQNDFDSVWAYDVNFYTSVLSPYVLYNNPTEGLEMIQYKNRKGS